MAYTVGSVPYANAYPLVRAFEKLGDLSPVQVVYAVPSELPAMLESGEVQAILVSSIEAFRSAGARVADSVCIGSRDEVKSVRLFSKVPFDQITSLALDASSLTSNQLALMILRETYGVEPVAISHAPALEPMLELADAAVLIGDIGMLAPSEGLYVLDLGLAWHRWTGLPFVWAVWLGNNGLDEELSTWLAWAGLQMTDHSVPGPSPLEPWLADRRYATIQEAAMKWGWSLEQMRDYYASVMAFELDAEMRAGLARWQSELASHMQGISLEPVEWVKSRRSPKIGPAVALLDSRKSLAN